MEWRADHTDVHDLIGGNIHDQLTEQILRVGRLRPIMLFLLCELTGQAEYC